MTKKLTKSFKLGGETYVCSLVDSSHLHVCTLAYPKGWIYPVKDAKGAFETLTKFSLYGVIFGC